MKWPFPLFSPQPPTLKRCSYSYPVRICVGSDACNFTIPHLCLFPPVLRKSGKKREKKREPSENSRRYYRAACMAPVLLPFHLCFLLYWQMVVIRQYGNTVVKIVFTDFFFFLWYLWPDDHHESVVVLNRGPLCQRCLNQKTNVCHMGMTHYLQTAWVFGKWGGVLRVRVLHCIITRQSVDIWLKWWIDLLIHNTLIGD